MIGYLAGTMVSEDVVVTSDGVGWAVTCDQTHPVGEHVELWVSTHVRETAINLYGFTSQTSKCLFDALCGVHGVGASKAISLMRHLGAAVVARALHTEDAALLRAPGVGAATARKICANHNISPETLLAAMADGDAGGHTPAEIAEPDGTGDVEVDELVAVLEDFGWTDRARIIDAARHAVSVANDDAERVSIAMGALTATP